MSVDWKPVPVNLILDDCCNGTVLFRHIQLRGGVPCAVHEMLTDSEANWVTVLNTSAIMGGSMGMMYPHKLLTTLSYSRNNCK